MNNIISKYEADVLDELFKTDSMGRVLFSQLNLCNRTNRKYTGHGFFLEFFLDEKAIPIAGQPDCILGPIDGKLEGLARGAGYVLFIRKGLMSTLEGFAYAEPWPRSIGAYGFKPSED